MSRRSIAIIGAGFSGAMLALQILATSTGRPLRVFLIERSGRFGPGLAYGTTHPAHLLNARSSSVSASATRPNDFITWLRFCGRDQACDIDFARRGAYGAYLEAQVRRLSHASEPGALALVRDSAIACHPDREGVTIILSSGPPLRVDAAVFALGNQAPITPAPFDTLPAEDGAQLIDPWDTTALSRIRPTQEVLLVGTGLTMVDTALALTAIPRTGKIYALSRHGLTPRAHSEAPRKSALEPLELSDTLSQALPELREEIAACIDRGEPWQSVFDRLRGDLAEHWSALPAATQRRFLRHLRPYWDTHRHRTAPHVNAWIQALRTAGILEVVAGRVREAAQNENGYTITYAPRGARQSLALKVAHIINCTGPCADIRRSCDPLLRQTLRDGIIAPHPSDLGFNVLDDGRLLDANGRAHTNLFTLGPLTQGAFWESTAIPEIRTRAIALARLLWRTTLRISENERALSAVLTPSAAISFDASSL